MTTPLVNPGRSQTDQPIRLNIGCGGYPLDRAHWTNIDSSPESAADVYADVPPIPYADGCVTEVWACHYLEHLSFEAGAEFLRECYRVLVPGGQLGIVVPDTREIMRRYIAGEPSPVQIPANQWWKMNDLDDICSVFLFSTIQPSCHLWAYDEMTLRRAMERAGFRVLKAIDRHYDKRLGMGAWYQCGWQAVKD